jgi:hypothetical protein
MQERQRPVARENVQLFEEGSLPFGIGSASGGEAVDRGEPGSLWLRLQRAKRGVG